jgi:hypothetical protein
MDQDDRPTLPDISMFTLRHRLKAGGRVRASGFTAAENDITPWPVSHLKGSSLQTIDVQIAIKDQVYAEELRRLLVKDNKHRVYLVDRPDPNMGGIVVLDETTLSSISPLEGIDQPRYIVLRQESSDPDKLWKAGVRCLLPAMYPPNLARTVILGAEMRLSIEKSLGGVSNRGD